LKAWLNSGTGIVSLRPSSMFSLINTKLLIFSTREDLIAPPWPGRTDPPLVALLPLFSLPAQHGNSAGIRERIIEKKPVNLGGSSAFYQLLLTIPSHTPQVRRMLFVTL